MTFKDWIRPLMVDMLSPSEIKRMESVWNFAKADDRRVLEDIWAVLNNSEYPEDALARIHRIVEREREVKA
jgi:hypothetical protein